MLDPKTAELFPNARIGESRRFLKHIRSFVEHRVDGAEKISQHPRARNDYDEETAYESYMNPEPGFQSGPGDSVDAD